MNEIIQSLPFGWKETARYTILDLGTMSNAIVVKTEEMGHNFIISLRSHFPFPEHYYNLRFDTKEEAMKCATDYLVKWLEQLNNKLLSNQ